MHAAAGVIQGKSIEDIREEREERERQREIQRQKEAEERKKKQEAKERGKEENKKRFKESTKGQNKKKEKSWWDNACDWVKDKADALVSTVERAAHKVKKGIDKLCIP